MPIMVYTFYVCYRLTSQGLQSWSLQTKVSKIPNLHTLEGDGVNSYIHTLTNFQGILKWLFAISRLTVPFYYGLMSNLVICKDTKSMVIHDTKHSYWDQAWLNTSNSIIFLHISRDNIKCYFTSSSLRPLPTGSLVMYCVFNIWNAVAK